jgi:hypothetical protein
VVRHVCHARDESETRVAGVCEHAAAQQGMHTHRSHALAPHIAPAPAHTHTHTHTHTRARAHTHTHLALPRAAGRAGLERHDRVVALGAVGAQRINVALAHQRPGRVPCVCVSGGASRAHSNTHAATHTHTHKHTHARVHAGGDNSTQPRSRRTTAACS